VSRVTKKNVWRTEKESGNELLGDSFGDVNVSKCPLCLYSQM
jgi:hypothetical protein